MTFNSLQYLNEVCRLCCDEAKLMIPLDDLITLDYPDKRSLQLDLNSLVHYCLDLNITDLDANFPNNPKMICNNCVKKLITFYKFKESCKNNNDLYFMCEGAVEMVEEMVEETEELIESQVEVAPLKQEDESQLSTSIVYEDAFETSYKVVMSKKSGRKDKNNSRNAERQKLKRMLETPEEKEIRRQKVAEQTRLRRERLKHENPEKYEDTLKKVAERKRIRRMNMSEMEKLNLRQKESTSARCRRQQLSPEQKEVYKQKNRDSARARRTKIPMFDIKDENDDTCSSTQEQEIYFIEQV